MWMRIVLLAVGGVLIVAIAATGITRYWFQHRLDRDVKRFAAELPQPAMPSPAELDALPDPVRRYLSFTNPTGRAPVRAARLEHGGEFRLQEGDAWLPMQAVEQFFTPRPAFFWNARIRMLPLLTVVVHDRYAAGVGDVDARLLGAVPIARAQGPEVAQSALMRLLAELPLVPTALLPSPWLRWEAMDANHARAIVTDSGVTGSAVFSFEDDGRLSGYITEDRYRRVGDRNVRTPFFGRWGEYRSFGGLMAPAYGEAGWLIDGHEFLYVRLRVQQLRYDGP